MGMNPGNQANLNQGQNPQQNSMPQAQQNRQENIIVNQFAKRLMDSCKDDIRQRFQQDVQAWPEDKKQQLQAQGISPLFFRFRQHAEMLYKRGALGNHLQQGANGNPMQPGGQNRMLNQAGMNQRQPNQEFDFNAIANQQIEAMRVQDQGAMVVPASNNMNGTQMNSFPGPNGQQPQSQNPAMAAQRQAEAAAFQNNMQRQQHAQQVAQAQQQAQQQAQAQQHAQAQLEQQRQRQAQQQARNPNQLLGLNGGLNLPPTTGSPAPMSMLNRPMHPPGGQPGPPTAQQQPQNHVPVMTPRGNGQEVSAVLREAQLRANAVAHTNQPLTEHVRMSMMPQDLDPQVKAQLLKVPEQQFRAILQQYVHNARRTNGMVPFLGPQMGQTFNPQPPQPGMPTQMLGGANMARPGLNIGQQGLGAGPQTPMGQRPQQANQQQRLATAHNMLRQSPGIINATDGKPYPPNVLNAQVKANVPPEVTTWGQLKQWAQQNPNMMPGVSMDKLVLLQALHFQDLVRQQNGSAPGQLPQQSNMPGVAPAQQMPPQGPMRTPQQQPNMPNMPPIQVTQQEMMQVRQKLQAQGQNVNITDDALRNYIVNQKRQQQQRAQQQHQQQQQQQQQMLQQQAAQQRAGQQQMQMAAMASQQQMPNRPPTAQSQNAQATPQQKPAARPQQQQQAAQPNASKKRPIDDTADVNMDGNATNAAPQAPAMVPNKSGAGINFSPEQISKMTPAQQAQMRAQLLKAQDASNAAGNKAQQPSQPMLSAEEIRTRMNDPARMKAFNQIVKEVESSMPSRQNVPLQPQLRVSLQKSLKDQLDKLKKLEQAMRVYHVCYDAPASEKIVRQIAQSRALLFQQIDPQDGTLHDQLTLSAEDFKTHMRAALGFYAKITARMAQQQQPQNGAQQSQPPAGPNVPLAQLNAANLKIVEQQQRQQKAPSAPTTDRPPFALGDQAARGAPTYFDTANKVTNLVLPDKKRTKLDNVSQASTPGPKASPRIGTGKGLSPEFTRQQAPDKQVPQRPTFRCKVADCEYSVRGFESQGELDSHIAQMHMKIENPLQFALESMAEYLDVDPKTGDAKVDPNAKRPAKSAPAASRSAHPVKSENTPNVPLNAVTPAGTQAAATPMARVPTQTGMKSSPMTNFLKTPQAMAKVGTPGTSVHAKATPTSMPRPAPKEQAVAAAEPEKEDELQPLMPMSLLDYSYEDTFAALDANGPFTVLDLKDEDTTWAFRSRPASPMTTPDSSAKDTPSTRTSDISENDNLHINLDLKDMDMPDAWAMGFNGNALPIDIQLSEDMQTLGVMLPPMDSDDMMLFPSYGDGMMDLDALEKTMESMGNSLDMSVIPTI
jgi:hypothetical protein